MHYLKIQELDFSLPIIKELFYSRTTCFWNSSYFVSEIYGPKSHAKGTGYIAQFILKEQITETQESLRNFPYYIRLGSTWQVEIIAVRRGCRLCSEIGVGIRQVATTSESTQDFLCELEIDLPPPDWLFKDHCSAYPDSTLNHDLVTLENQNFLT
jgi:hypothetical protein